MYRETKEEKIPKVVSRARRASGNKKKFLYIIEGLIFVNFYNNNMNNLHIELFGLISISE